jgi:hypothetical protein
VGMMQDWGEPLTRLGPPRRGSRATQRSCRRFATQNAGPLNRCRLDGTLRCRLPPGTRPGTNGLPGRTKEQTRTTARRAQTPMTGRNQVSQAHTVASNEPNLINGVRTRVSSLIELVCACRSNSHVHTYQCIRHQQRVYSNRFQSIQPAPQRNPIAIDEHSQSYQFTLPCPRILDPRVFPA